MNTTSRGFVLIFVSFFIGVFGQDVITVDIISGNSLLPSLKVDLPSGVTEYKCIVNLPNGKVIENPTAEDKDLKSLEFEFKKPCSLTSNKVWDLARTGAYKLKITYEEEEKGEYKNGKYADGEKVPKEVSRTYNVNYIHQTVPSMPLIFSDQILSVQMKSPDVNLVQIKTCEWSKLLDDGTHSKAERGVVSEGVCKLSLVKIEKSNQGFYESIGVSSAGHRLKAMTVVEVVDQNEFEKTEKNITVVLSSSPNNIIEPKIKDVKILRCSLYNNEKKLVMTSFESCKFAVNPTKYHEGIWTAKLVLTGKIDVFEQNIKVLVVEKTMPIRTSCKPGSDKEVNILCKYIESQEKTCLFVGPKGQMISSMDGIGNNDYSFYTDINAKDGMHCGLTIKSLSEKDNGLWKCVIKDVGSTYIDVNKGCEKRNDTDFTLNAPKTFYAIAGKEARNPLLKCSIDTNVDYCLFRTTLGQEILGQVSADEPGSCSFATDFEYYANNTGKWQCIMVVPGQSKEYSKEIDVTVVEKWFQPSKREFVYKNGAELECGIQRPNANEASYCRFIRPDGVTIRLEPGTTFEHYTSTSVPVNGVCGLKLSSMIPADKGKWYCSSLDVNADAWVSNQFSLSSAIANIPLKLFTIVSILIVWYSL